MDWGSIPDDAEDVRQVPLAVILVTGGSTGEKLLFLHPFVPKNDNVYLLQPNNRSPGLLVKVEQNKTLEKNAVPALITEAYQQQTSGTQSIMTQFGLSTQMLANILNVRKIQDCDQPFEMKIDNVRFAGYPKRITTFSGSDSGAHASFSVVFVLPANVDAYIVEGFQVLSKKLALAIDALQTMHEYFSKEESILCEVQENLENVSEYEGHVNPWQKAPEKSKLAAMLIKVYDDVMKTGVVQVFVDDFIEVGFCLESKAFLHAHLAPKNRMEIDRLVQRIRPYHGILLLEDVWPTPDGNPSVTLLLKHCTPDRSIKDIATSSGIPLLQVFIIVRHLLLWARAIVIYPLADSNVYTSATRPQPLGKLIENFNHKFSFCTHLAAALAHFNPPATLGSFVRKEKMLSEQHIPANVIVFLLRHQLIMQLHKFCYIAPPLTGTELPSPKNKAPDDISQSIGLSKLPITVHDIVIDMCGVMLEQNKESYSTVKCRLELFLKMSDMLHGQHHVEDIMYRLNEERQVVEEVLETFSLVLSTFLRPDFIAE